VHETGLQAMLHYSQNKNSDFHMSVEYGNMSVDFVRMGIGSKDQICDKLIDIVERTMIENNLNTHGMFTLISVAICQLSDLRYSHYDFDIGVTWSSTHNHSNVRDEHELIDVGDASKSRDNKKRKSRKADKARSKSTGKKKTNVEDNEYDEPIDESTKSRQRKKARKGDKLRSKSRGKKKKRSKSKYGKKKSVKENVNDESVDECTELVGEDWEDWSVNDVADWISCLFDDESYNEIVVDLGVTGSDLKELTMSELKGDIGINEWSDRTKLLGAIKGLE